MALTRARVIAGPKTLAVRVTAAIHHRLMQKSDAAKIVTDARDMRQKVAAQYPGDNHWDIKYAAGGLVDIEFLVQTLQLVHAHAHPEILDTNTLAALKKIAAAGLLDNKDAALLIGSAELQQALTQTLRIALTETLKAEEATPGLKQLLARDGDAPDFAALEQCLREAQTGTHTLFTGLMAGPGTGPGMA